HVLHYLVASNALGNGLRVRTMMLPDRFVAHGAPNDQYTDAGHMARDIVGEVFRALDDEAKLRVLKAKA
ncbi:MAG: 1-deoxy-D-xylulose-5-phosphate synthase, partial [Parvibaculaceae bacterium]